MTRSSARERLDEALARIDDPKGEGTRTCLTVYREAARAAAEAADARAKAGVTLGGLDGAIVSVKDLFDVAGEVTRAGSQVVAEESNPAAADAPVVRRLRQAGAVIVAKTNMSEFAFSGLGANPHFGTPGNPADRARVPGGSTSGGAIAVADGMCEITIGSDTGGSTRIPAALCGIVGFKPSKWRIPTTGAFPLSSTLDSIGPMARTVANCAKADAVMANEEPHPLEPAPLAGLRIGLPQGFPLDNLDDTVGKRFSEALARLEKAGARLLDEKIALIDEVAPVNAKGGLVPPEALGVHNARIEQHGDMVDPNIRVRIERARAISAGTYLEMLEARARLVKAMDTRLADLDVLAMPTCPIVAPTIAEVEAPDMWARKNAMVLRNTSLGNFFDLTSISLPLPGSGLPVGLMLMARNGHDRRLLRIAAAIERLLAG
jgi:aspartyl-tRNA(Asn)/glutamyl-tRNA(Gln) amidotransferase subunit A